MERRLYTQLQARWKEASEVFFIPDVPQTSKAECGRRQYYGLSGCYFIAGRKWDVNEWFHDSQALFALKHLLISSSPHQQAQRRAVSVWKPLLSCCHLLQPVSPRQFPDNEYWQQPLPVSSDGCCCC